MKKLLFASFLFIPVLLFSQSPQSFKYQALLRDKNGILMIEKNVSVRISILQGTITGASVYSEIHKTQTSTTGTINLEIGKGIFPTAAFSSINWALGTYFVKIEMDQAGGDVFELIGTSQLLSVPYALFAQKSGDEKWNNTTTGIYYNSGSVGIGTTTPSSKLDIQGLNATEGLYKTRFRGTESDNKGRLEIRNDPDDAGNIYSTSLNRIGDSSEDLFFGLQQPIGNSTSWNIMESWYGAGLMVSASGPDLKPLVFGIDRIEKARLNANGNFGIGTSTPQYSLDVNGVINAKQFLLNGVALNSSAGQQPWTTIGTGNIYYNSGSVGIGTSTPSSKLDIQGLNATSGLYKVQFKGTESENKGRLEIKSDANDIGNIYSTSLNRTGDASEDLLFGLQQPIGNSTSWNIMESWNGAGLMVSASGPDLKPLVFGIDRTEKARLSSNGNFGIGTTTPLYSLDVNGTINAKQFLLNGTAINLSSAQPWTIASGNVYYNSGSVGIGTTTPSSKLDIQGLNATSGLYKTQFKGTESENKGRLEIKSDPSDIGNLYSTSLDRIGDTSEDLVFGLQQPINNTTSWNIIESWRGAGLMVSSSSPDLTPLTFGIDRVEKARIDINGNFGIGTNNPKAKLQVENGDIYINSVTSGVIMKSPNGGCWRMTVSNGGAPIFSSVTCP